MWNDVLNIAISNGIFATLFVSLFVYQLKDSSAREKKYQKTIDSLAKELGVVEEIKQDVNTYIVSFNSDGGTTIENQIVEEGKKAVEPETPVKDNYEFNGY